MCLFVGLLWERLCVPTQVPLEPPPLGFLAGGTGAAAFPSALPAFYKTGIFLRPPNRSSQWTQQWGAEGAWAFSLRRQQWLLPVLDSCAGGSSPARGGSHAGLRVVGLFFMGLSREENPQNA